MIIIIIGSPYRLNVFVIYYSLYRYAGSPCVKHWRRRGLQDLEVYYITFYVASSLGVYVEQ
jgi:hypothetical protein